MKKNYVIKEVRKCGKQGWCLIDIQYDGRAKIYTYKRRYYERKKFNLVVLNKSIYEFNFNFLGRCVGADVKFRRDTDNEGDNIEQEIETKENEEVVEAEVTETEVEVKKEEVELDKEILHKEHETIKACIESNIPVYLAGPAGSGKSHVLEQIARELDMEFYSSNSIQQEFKLTGFIDAGGDYHDTEFFRACNDDKDCIFFIDELDASVPEVLVLLNTAIANGYFEFPVGKCNLEHVHFVAAGNTVGNGADEMYTGRMVIDQSTLDRFVIIDFDYDRNIELYLTKNNTELVDFVRELRKITETNGVRATFSYRCLTMVTKLEGKLDLEKVLKISVFKGMDKDTLNTIHPMLSNNKYNDAFRKMKMAA